VNIYKKEKHMNWLRDKIKDWLNGPYVSEVKSSLRGDTGSVNAKTSLRFTIYPASGGYVIEHYKLDRYKDSEGPVLTIVNNGEDIGRTVEHLVAVESLRS
jgi:hypothetical protein